MDWWIPVVIAVPALVGIVALFIARAKKGVDRGALASSLGLVEQAGVLRGMDQGFALVIETREGGDAKGQRRMVFRVDFPHQLGLGISIMGRSSGQRNLRALVTGDAAFDGAVAVQANDEQAVRDYLTPERRECLRQMIGSDPRAFVNDTSIVFNRDGATDDAALLKQIIDYLLDLGVELFPDRGARKVARLAARQAGARPGRKA